MVGDTPDQDNNPFTQYPNDLDGEGFSNHGYQPYDPRLNEANNQPNWLPPLYTLHE